MTEDDVGRIALAAVLVGLAIVSIGLAFAVRWLARQPGGRVPRIVASVVGALAIVVVGGIVDAETDLPEAVGLVWMGLAGLVLWAGLRRR